MFSIQRRTWQKVCISGWYFSVRLKLDSSATHRWLVAFSLAVVSMSRGYYYCTLSQRVHKRGTAQSLSIWGQKLKLRTLTRSETRSNHDVGDLQVGAQKEAPISNLEFRVEWPFKTYFPSQSSVFPVVLNSLTSEFPVVFNEAEIMLDWQHGKCWIFILLSLEKRPLNPDLEQTPTPLSSRLVIALQHLQLATDSLQTAYCWICDFQHVV